MRVCACAYIWLCACVRAYDVHICVYACTFVCMRMRVCMCYGCVCGFACCMHERVRIYAYVYAYAYIYIQGGQSKPSTGVMMQCCIV